PLNFLSAPPAASAEGMPSRSARVPRRAAPMPPGTTRPGRRRGGARSSCRRRGAGAPARPGQQPVRDTDGALAEAAFAIGEIELPHPDEALVEAACAYR